MKTQQDLMKAVHAMLDLKDIKEMIERGAGTPFQRDYYAKNKDSAWLELRECMHDLREPLLPSSLLVQEGGQHYKGRAIQPIEYITANNLNFSEGSVIKYTTRHRNKAGIEDLKKALHYLRFLLEFDYGVRSSVQYEDPRT